MLNKIVFEKQKHPNYIETPGGFYSGTFWISLVMAFLRKGRALGEPCLG
jgi:hypothetical protein